MIPVNIIASRRPLTRGRGLKLSIVNTLLLWFRSPPYTGAWIETIHVSLPIKPSLVAPLHGGVD